MKNSHYPYINEKGFTLLEVTVVLGILSFLGGIMALTTITIMNYTPLTSDRLIALQQVQAAGLMMTRDVQTAQSINTSPDGEGEFIVLTQEVVGSTSTTITYKFSTSDNGVSQLMRLATSGNTTLVADNIYFNPLSDPNKSTKVVSYLNNDLTVQITSISGSTTITKKYIATQRVPSSP
jgi:prepilin-type N-terminal cleavage/methylation domain-containing protein